MFLNVYKRFRFPLRKPEAFYLAKYHCVVYKSIGFWQIASTRVLPIPFTKERIRIVGFPHRQFLR